uniref:Fatty acyl-CoA reductase n=1 Tax=Timema shepardi TaxID=629360 RepID=A0A7R9B4N3_TIMSH|nr:unnamed protein product [Timema shepardi]
MWPELFDRLKSEQDGVLSRKVVGVAGDVLISPDLGLSLADKELLCRDVSIVYHGAATIRFDEPLKRAVMLNTRGTRQMLELAKEMPKLEAKDFSVASSSCISPESRSCDSVTGVIDKAITNKEQDPNESNGKFN